MIDTANRWARTVADAKPKQTPGKPAPKNSSPKISPAKKSPAKKSQNPTGKARVAASRQAGISRTTWLLAGLALAVVIGIVVTAVVVGSSKSDAALTGHGTSSLSTATLADGAILVSVGSPTKTIDIYEDALCPICGAFEQASGAEIGQAIDNSTVAINYRPLDFLNAGSSSGDYSTRATAALMCVVDKAGSIPGVFSSFHGLLFSPNFQPAERGTSDHTNQELADAAAANGAGAASQCISGGEMLAQAATITQGSSATLTSVAGKVSSPSVIYQGRSVNWQSPNWFANLLAQG